MAWDVIFHDDFEIEFDGFREDVQNKAFAVFDIKIGNIWLRRTDVQDIVERLALPMVPTLCHGHLMKGVGWVTGGLRSRFGDFYAEGLVARPLAGFLDRRGHRIICKIKHKEIWQNPNK